MIDKEGDLRMLYKIRCTYVILNENVEKRMLFKEGKVSESTDYRRTP